MLRVPSSASRHLPSQVFSEKLSTIVVPLLRNHGKFAVPLQARLFPVMKTICIEHVYIHICMYIHLYPVMHSVSTCIRCSAETFALRKSLAETAANYNRVFRWCKSFYMPPRLLIFKSSDFLSFYIHFDLDRKVVNNNLFRISYCSADATHDHVFAFIATNLNETMECHAFLCPKRKMAQTVTLTVAQAFNTAYEAWQLSQADPRIHHAQDKSPSLNDDRNGRWINLFRDHLTMPRYAN